MKRNNLLIKISILVVVLTVATACVLSGTFAKYTTTVLGQDTISVARFGYEALDGAGGTVYTTETAVAIDLFENAQTDATGTVADDTGDLYLAPGVYGSFAIVLDGATTDVDLTMAGSTVAASATGNMDTDVDAFISYVITYGVGSANELEEPDYTSGTRATPDAFAAEVGAALSTITLAKNTVGYMMVYWKWVDANDGADTALGQKWAAADADAPVLTLTISNKATQIMTASPTITEECTLNLWTVTFDGGAGAVLTAGQKYYVFANNATTILTPPTYTNGALTLTWSPEVPGTEQTITADRLYTATWA